MDPYLLLKTIGFFLLVIIGIPGNMFIITQFVLVKIIEKKLLPTNIILTMLATANLLVIFSRIIFQLLNAIGLEDLLDESECKFMIFTYRVSRAMSIGITSLLSCHQCILIAPSTKVWSYLKQKVSQNVMTVMIILCVLLISMYSYNILITHARKNTTSSPYTLHLVYCDVDFVTYTTYIVNGTFYALRDFIFVTLMMLASIYIVYTLVQHERTVRGIRSSDRGQKTSTEYKASRAVILLVALYVILYGLDNSMWVYTLTLSNVSPNMNDIRVFLASSYASLSPILIIGTNPKLKHSWKYSDGKKTFPKNTSDNGLVFSIKAKEGGVQPHLVNRLVFRKAQALDGYSKALSGLNNSLACYNEPGLCLDPGQLLCDSTWNATTRLLVRKNRNPHTTSCL
ncbi:olfactory receptor class A-like protein 1 [Dendropsophus ebraccatus]|uniref:olfactory receptor class A-like protein 1 n=1 Tax=Dendropsophus ebraccatus TaxID=150705 RepID=UPI0038318081